MEESAGPAHTPACSTEEEQEDHGVMFTKSRSCCSAPTPSSSSSSSFRATTRIAEKETQLCHQNERLCGLDAIIGTLTTTTKLYGRQQEQEEMLRVYQRVKKPEESGDGDSSPTRRTEFILIEGSTGTGKSALAEKFLVQEHGDAGASDQDDDDDSSPYRITGKFDQLVQLQRPHSAFVEAFSAYALSVAERGDGERVRRAVQDSMRVDASHSRDAIQVVANMVPALADLLMEQQQHRNTEEETAHTDNNNSSSSTFSVLFGGGTDASSPSSRGFGGFNSPEASTHCKYAFRVFLRAISSPETPLVLVLDDCHWMDETALDILQSLLTDTSNQGILFVGTCRNDTDSNERFTAMLEQLSPSEVNVTRINLTNLDEAATRKMTADILRVDESQAQSLASQILTQTNGNVFFILEFLRTLVEEGYLRYNHQTSATNPWSWDANELRVVFGETISQLVDRKISQLPDPVLETLKYASCLGTKVDEEILGHLLVGDHSSIASWLNVAATMGFLDRSIGSSGESSWAFSHDTIREVTYNTIPPNKRSEFHYRIGRRLFRAFAMKEATDDRIFIVVSQLMAGSAFIPDEKERMGVASLCYDAGARAVRASSFESARRYLQHAISLLEPTSCWRDEYDLALRVFNAAAEVAYCTGHFEEVHSLVNEVSRHASCLDDMVHSHITKVHALGSSGKVEAAIEYGIAVLRDLGEDFSARASLIGIFIEVQKIRRRVKRKTSESLLRIPDMNDRRKSAAMSLLNHLFMYLFVYQPARAPMFAMRMVSLSLDYGLCATSCIGFTILGGLLCGKFNDIEEGYRLGRVGLAMYERFGIRAWLPRVSVCYFLFIHFWKDTIHSAVEPLSYTFEVGMSAGDVEFAIVAMVTAVWSQFEVRSLPDVEKDYQRLRERICFYGQSNLMTMTRPALQCIHNLLGRTAEPTMLVGDIMDTATLHQLQETNELFFVFAHFHLMMLSYLFGDTEKATACAKVVAPMTKDPLGGIEAALLVLFDGLIAARNAQIFGKWKYRRHAAKQLKRLRHWAKHSPHTFLCRQFLLEAELQVAKGDHLSVHSKYVAAIALAKNAGLLNITGLANELAARYYVQRNDEEQARPFGREALEYYGLWGAMAKVESLSQEFKRFV